MRLEAEADRERLEAQLHQSQRMESLGQLAGGVAHDFNNLLGVILNYAAFVAEELTSAAATPTGSQWAEPLKDVKQIQLAAERGALLTHQLLSFARREVVQARALSLNSAITRMEQILRRTIGEQIELVISLAPTCRWCWLTQAKSSRLFLTWSSMLATPCRRGNNLDRHRGEGDH